MIVIGMHVRYENGFYFSEYFDRLGTIEAGNLTAGTFPTIQQNTAILSGRNNRILILDQIMLSHDNWTTYEVCTKIDVTFLEPFEYFDPVPRKTIFGYVFPRSSYIFGKTDPISDLKFGGKLNENIEHPTPSFSYLSRGNMFESNSLSFDCISYGARKFENRLLSFNLKWLEAFVCSMNLSYSGNSMMRCGEKCIIKSKLFWSLNLSMFWRTKSNLSTKSMEGTSITEKFKVLISWSGVKFRLHCNVIPKNLNPLASLKFFEIIDSSLTPTKCCSNRDDARNPWNMSLRIDFNSQ